ncbi:MAG: hypothetical protein C4541_11190 [Candidatus Auribacter fodinae]|jgi:fermentation-respiration switch protein FrsA (DUF1100 family)|uniref:Peptidase S9 prolyl oligopeptidase catalytic domain-containing protein n=1 Tax=Candidatus Auribacter fodinae TaxID=2093366 RepID=A0A3A4QW66_9BACT|nr:MAG: hypothetical protein C4541_11190 [Candidatus Auribacter fodinae]
MPVICHHIIKAVCIVGGILIVYTLFIFFISVCPPRIETPVTPSDFGLDYEEVSFMTNDSIIIAGWFVPAKQKSDTAIIVCHGYPCDKNNVIESVSFLAEDYNLLLIDFRYFGQSEGRFTSLGYHEQKDIHAAVQWLKDRGFTKIGAWGFSLGASTLILTASPDIKALIADSGFADIHALINLIYGYIPSPLKKPFVWLTELHTALFLHVFVSDLAPVKKIPSYKIPIMIIHGDRDSQIPVSHAYRLYEASDQTFTRLWIVPGADHGQAQYLYPAEYKKRVRDFLSASF